MQRANWRQGTEKRQDKGWNRGSARRRSFLVCAGVSSEFAAWGHQRVRRRAVRRGRTSHPLAVATPKEEVSPRCHASRSPLPLSGPKRSSTASSGQCSCAANRALRPPDKRGTRGDRASAGWQLWRARDGLPSTTNEHIQTLANRPSRQALWPSHLAFPASETQACSRRARRRPTFWHRHGPKPPPAWAGMAKGSAGERHQMRGPDQRHAHHALH